MVNVVTPNGVSGWDEYRFAAEMTDRQFRSVDLRIRHASVLTEVGSLPRVLKPKCSATCSEPKVAQWLKNGWNTEHILALSSPVLDGASGAALQWTFPQAYYAAFASTLAFFQVAGFTEQGHQAVQRKFAQLILSGEYPAFLAFAADGTRRNMCFVGLSCTDSDKPAVHFDSSDPDSWDLQIARFLSSTRKQGLNQKKQDLKLKTKEGGPRRSFKEEHWELASQRLGATALLCLLYRKRIKSNYQDIDTFTTSDIDPRAIFDSLGRIVAAVSFVHEVFIAAAMGGDRYCKIADAYLRDCPDAPLEKRKDNVLSVLEGRP